MITPVRTGLLGVSAAVAVGAVAVSSGLLPGGGTYKVSGDIATGGQVQTDSAPTPNVRPQGGESERPTSAAPTPSHSASPSQPAKAAPTPSTPSTAPSPSASATRSAPSAAPSDTPRKKLQAPAPAPSKPASPSTAPTHSAPSAAPAQRGQVPSAEVSAAATVMSLVNQEREQVGCSPVAADPALGSLAAAFSDDMAARGFFDHTDPDGRTPWDRAAKAGVQGLGGENIARGQADAKAVMDAWMASPGHRANILNCQYKSLGVGVHFGPGGPWWTQDFGF
ncbi:CAP domain-containing protein [Streptomyces sp. NPDC048361]|uniref:CAP domain-containing protein n=1 Tax=Streptomyces sp. NPDC048361 TaxID=3154720 RepID=UPI003426B48E